MENILKILVFRGFALVDRDNDKRFFGNNETQK